MFLAEEDEHEGSEEDFSLSSAEDLHWSLLSSKYSDACDAEYMLSTLTSSILDLTDPPCEDEL
jgi:hypothetical protein